MLKISSYYWFFFPFFTEIINAVVICNKLVISFIFTVKEASYYSSPFSRFLASDTEMTQTHFRTKAAEGQYRLSCSGMELHLNLIPSNPAESSRAPADNVSTFNFYDSPLTQVQHCWPDSKLHVVFSCPEVGFVTLQVMKPVHIMFCQ